MTSTFLLDTHALIWALTEPDRLSDGAREVIESPRVQLVVSAVSAWEIATKARRGRMPEAEVVLAAYSRHIRRLRAQEVPITTEHALVSGGLDWDHHDPFDRMLAAQAILEGWTLVTRDRAFSRLTGLETLW
jgi:Uncharacterized protein conserved in bacteria